jgi:hypothetical protein
MVVEKAERFPPAIHGLFGARVGSVIVPEAMPGTVVSVKFVRFAVFLEFFFVLIHLIRRRVLVVVAEYPHHRACQVPGVVNRSYRLLWRQLILVHHHVPAPAFHEGIKPFHPACRQECVSAAGASPHYPYATIAVRQGP